MGCLNGKNCYNKILMKDKKSPAVRYQICMLLLLLPVFAVAAGKPTFWKVQAVDTMKYSRDIAREKINSSSFDAVIERQVSDIASVGATHIAIATPYDKEFAPFLKKWVNSARKNGLKVWFRGNWSGWEGWFDYPIISRDEHIAKTKKFILDNKDLFEDGDVFSACPECENGGPGDPRHNGDKQGHRDFLIKENKVMSEAFKKIGKDVIFNYNSMNGDVAEFVMNKATTEATGGIVAIDHYVRMVDKLIADIKNYQKQSGGEIVLGEFGVPIPDIHGRLTDSQQADWLNEALSKLVKNRSTVAINYWTNMGGSTSLWRDSGNAKEAVEVLRSYFIPRVLSGYVKDGLDRPLVGAKIAGEYSDAVAQDNGFFEIAILPVDDKILLNISHEGYQDKKIEGVSINEEIIVTLDQQKEGIWFKILKLFKRLLSFI